MEVICYSKSQKKLYSYHNEVEQRTAFLFHKVANSKKNK